MNKELTRAYMYMVYTHTANMLKIKHGRLELDSYLVRTISSGEFNPKSVGGDEGLD
jgi:hypothetical protein